jgi:hypothetical protein
MKHDEDVWLTKNRRRVALIDKQFSEGLNSAEAEELLGLQAEMDQRLETVAPLPYEELELLEERAREAVARVREQEDPVPGSP